MTRRRDVSTPRQTPSGLPIQRARAADGRLVLRYGIPRSGREAAQAAVVVAQERERERLEMDAATGRQHRAAQRARAVAGVRAKRDEAARDRAALRARVAVIRTAHPTLSTRAIAARLIDPALGEPERTRAIERTRKRLARLAGRK